MSLEWRFTLSPPDGAVSSLVPDVAVVMRERFEGVDDEVREHPTIAPDIVVEVLSPGDRPSRLARKIDIYRDFGTSLILIVDPLERIVRSIANLREEIAGPGDALRFERFPTLEIVIDELFANLD